MIDSLFQVSPAVLAVVPVAIGLVQLLKSNFSERTTPLLALVIGEVLAILAVGEVTTSVVVQGLVLGLMSMGLFSASKKVIS